MQQPSFREAVKFWTKLGFISFGGPAGQIALMHAFLVEQKKWISDSKFLHALNYCMVLPGPEAQQLATYMGWMLHGTRGGLAAGILFVLPSMFILLALSLVYVSFGNLPWVMALFQGLKPAVIAIVALALLKIGRKSLVGTLHYLVAIIAFICIYFFNIPFPLILLGTLLIGVGVAARFPSLLHTGAEQKEVLSAGESAYYVNAHSHAHKTQVSYRRMALQLTTGITLWLLPLLAFYLLSSDFTFWKTLSFFFTQAALVTFGGAYAVLPYVAQVSVEQLNWLSNLQMLDGLALGETTPGPLIMVLVFVGFLAGYNHFGHSLWMGTVGLLTTTWYTFLPCFLFIFIGAPLIERTQQNRHVKTFLALITAAVVGVMVNLTLYLAEAVWWPATSVAGANYPAIGWTLVSLVALHRFKVGMVPWMGISALFGLVCFLLNV